jgi:fructose-bisphosphate aldolase class II
MSIRPLPNLLGPAIEGGYGVLALNVFDDLTLRTAIETAESQRAPIVIQTSVKTVKAFGAKKLSGIFERSASGSSMPVSLHLDHCPYREVISECIANGWNSVLFDASHLMLDEATQQTAEVVAEAHANGVHVEGEVEGIQGVEDGIGSDDAPTVYSDDKIVDFIRTTGVDCFAPAIGNAHGLYKAAPTLDVDRVRRLFARTGVPMALHGGSGLTVAQFRELISAGCAKVNISTALKRTFVSSHREYLGDHSDSVEPLALIAHVRGQVAECVREHIELFAGAGSLR